MCIVHLNGNVCTHLQLVGVKHALRLWFITILKWLTLILYGVIKENLLVLKLYLLNLSKGYKLDIYQAIGTV